MNPNQIKETDLLGRFFLRAPNDGESSDCYRSLEAIRPLLKSKKWSESVTGYYINITDHLDGVRLSYFTSSPEQPKKVVDHFTSEHELENIKCPEVPHKTDDELRFRKYLVTYTQIGLDIMKADLFNARCLFATFRWQVMTARKPYKPRFIRTFQTQSPFYNSLSSAEKDQFWKDLAYWPNPPQVDRAHLFVNMVLGFDFIWPEAWSQLLQDGPALSILEINELMKRNRKLLKQQYFQIPNNWHP